MGARSITNTRGNVWSPPTSPGLPSSITYTVISEDGQRFEGVSPKVRPGGEDVEIVPAPHGAPVHIVCVNGVCEFYVEGESLDFDDCKGGTPPPPPPPPPGDEPEEPEDPGGPAPPGEEVA